MPNCRTILLFCLFLLAPVSLRSQDSSEPTEDRLARLEAGTAQGRGRTGFMYQFGDWFWQDVMLATYELGAGSWDRCFPPEQEMSGTEAGTYPYRSGRPRLLLPRRLTDPMLPFVRADYAYVYENKDLYADDGRLELGIGPFAVQRRQTRWIARNPHGVLTLEQWHAMLRLSISSSWEVDLGAGELLIDGGERYRNHSYTAPVLFYPKDWLGFEFRPSWAHVHGDWIEDYEAAVVLRFSAVSLRFGHRWIRGDGESYDGGFAGASVHF